MSAEGLKYAFTKCANYLKLKENADLGLTVLVSPKWVMVSFIKDSYVKVGVDTPLYLDGFAYAGLLQLQTVDPNWPQTAGINPERLGVRDCLIRSAVAYK